MFDIQLAVEKGICKHGMTWYWYGIMRTWFSINETLP